MIGGIIIEGVRKVWTLIIGYYEGMIIDRVNCVIECDVRAGRSVSMAYVLSIFVVLEIVDGHFKALLF